MNFLNFFNYI